MHWALLLLKEKKGVFGFYFNYNSHLWGWRSVVVEAEVRQRCTVFLCPCWWLYKANPGWLRKLRRANIKLKLLLFLPVLLLLSETVHLAVVKISVQRRTSVDMAKGVDRRSSDFDLNCYKNSVTSLDSVVVVIPISVWLKGCCDVSGNLMSSAYWFCLMPGCGKCTNVGLKTPQEIKPTSDRVQNSPGIGLIMMLMFA